MTIVSGRRRPSLNRGGIIKPGPEILDEPLSAQELKQRLQRERADDPEARLAESQTGSLKRKFQKVSL